MAFEYEALVGHLYIVGGRAIRTSPPGTLVEVAPQKAARGRETDTFFCMVLPSEDAIAPTAFYEQMVARAAQIYFDSTGSVTAGLRDLLMKLNQNLFDHNQSNNRPYEANIICAVLREDDLIVARVGCGVMLITDGDTVSAFPEDLTDDESLYIAPLGVHPMPNIKMKQFRVRANTRAVFGSVHMAELNRAQMDEALYTADLSMLLVGFKALARLQLTLLAVEFVLPDVPESSEIPTGQSTTEVLSKARETAKTGTETTSTASDTSETGASPAPALNGRRKRRANPTDEIERRTKRGIGQAAVGLAGGLSIFNKVLNHFLGERENGKRGWLATPIGAGAVVLLPVIVVGLVVVLWLSRAGESEYELCLTEAQSGVNLARSVVNNERQTVLNAWDIALAKVAECDSLRPGSPELRAIIDEGREVVDGWNQITRRQAQVIESFPQARLSRMAIRGDNIYVLDSANNIVYSMLLDNSGLGLSRPGTPIVQTGRAIQNIPIGELIDIAYNVDNNVLAVLDRQGTLVQCSPRFNDCTAQRLLGVENWVNPIAMTVWSGRLYVLDTGVGDSGQIWRYVPSGSGYGNGPTETFTSTRPNLRAAIDLEIDTGGTIYILMANGDLNKFNAGQPQQFGFDAFPLGQRPESATSMFLDTAPISQALYVVQQSTRTIFETTLIGGFRKSYRITQEDNFNLVSSVVAAPARSGVELIYAASGNTVFAFEKD